MRIAVDLNRCQGYGQCVYLAHVVFRLTGQEEDRATKQVRLAGGEQIPYDRLLIATGTRPRQWPNPDEAALGGVYTLRSRDDAAQLQKALDAPPSRVATAQSAAGVVTAVVSAPVTVTGTGLMNAACRRLP